LIERLSNQYIPWKKEQDRKARERKLAKKSLHNGNSDEAKENRASVASTNSSQAVEVVVVKRQAGINASAEKLKVELQTPVQSRRGSLLVLRLT
jgi:hypothetical protein